jgi:hypothetical protein
MITFAGFTYRSSGIIRGKQVSQFIEGSDFVDIDSPKHSKNNIVIHVRKFNEDYARFCKSKNLTVGFEVADNPVTDYLYGRVQQDDFSRYVSKYCDFYIVNNDVCKQELSKFTDKKIYVIPHHNCNFAKKINQLKNKPKRLGYIGVPEYTLNEKSLESFCKKANLVFTSKNPEKHEELEEAFNQIDIGIVFFEKDSIKSGVYERTIKYKPNTKLTNFQSFGIPTICLPYESYKQFGENQCIFVENAEELQDKIIEISSNEDLYFSLSKTSINVGEKHHISKVIEYYLQISRDFK